MEIPLDIEKNNFLIETTTIVVATHEVHNGVFMETKNVRIQILGRIFQENTNFYQANLIKRPSQSHEQNNNLSKDFESYICATPLQNKIGTSTSKTRPNS